jgi:hypothetical protein
VRTPALVACCRSVPPSTRSSSMKETDAGEGDFGRKCKLLRCSGFHKITLGKRSRKRA